MKKIDFANLAISSTLVSAEENHLSFLKSHGFNSIEEWKATQRNRKSKLVPPEWD